jgi:hypothetical protein
MVVGVRLDRRTGGDSYVPTGHVHCLLRSSPCVLLDIARLGIEVPVRSHNQEFHQRCKELVEMFPLVANERLNLDDVVSAYDVHMRGKHADSAYPLGAMTDVALLLAWGGRVDAAIEYVRNGGREIAEWPDWVHEKVPEAFAWESTTKLVIATADLAQLADDEASKLKLEALVDHGLLA